MNRLTQFSVVAVLAVVILAGSAAPAFAQSATSTPGGHRRPYVAGYVDSINNKGPWLLSNPSGMVTYINVKPVTAEERSAFELWKQTLKALFHIDHVDAQ